MSASNIVLNAANAAAAQTRWYFLALFVSVILGGICGWRTMSDGEGPVAAVLDGVAMGFSSWAFGLLVGFVMLVLLQ